MVVISDGEKTDSGAQATRKERTTEFQFQHVFHPKDGQEAVYERMIEQGAPIASLAAAGGDTSLLSALFRGHNITLLAYGQTGTGKTWSVEGPSGAMLASMHAHLLPGAGGVGESMNDTVYAYRGLIPRLVENIFRRLQSEHEARVAAAATAASEPSPAGAASSTASAPQSESLPAGTSAAASGPIASAGSSVAFPEVSVQVSFFELYRTKIRDLLAEGKSVYNEEEERSVPGQGAPNSSPVSSPTNQDGRPAFTINGLASPSPPPSGRALTLLLKDKQVVVSGLSERNLVDSRGVLKALKEGQKWRTVGKTKANAFSSRGHAVFDVFLKQTLPASSTTAGGAGAESVTVVSRLRFVDLAGSEQNLESGGDPERLLEAREINRSLTFLGKVITSLSLRSAHVNYRDSMLTRVLQTSFGGNAITLLLVTCSPARHSLKKTVNTLRFGAQASTILNAVTVNKRKNRFGEGKEGAALAGMGGAGLFGAGGGQNFSLPLGSNPELWEEIACWNRLQTLHHQPVGLKAVPVDFVRALLREAKECMRWRWR